MEYNNDDLETAEWPAMKLDAIEQHHIIQLMNGDVGAAIVSGYCSNDACDALAKGLAGSPQRRNYDVRWQRLGTGLTPFEGVSPSGRELSDTDRVGITDSDTLEDQSHAIEGVRYMRALTAPYLHPIDRLRLELDEALSGGARLGTNKSGNKAMAGIGRVMEKAAGFIHADVGRKSCLSASIMLSDTGGEPATRIWKHQGDFVDGTRTVLFSKEDLPSDAPSIELTPERCDLYIFNPLYPHVVLPFSTPHRITLQVWIKISTSQDGVSATLFN